MVHTLILSQINPPMVFGPVVHYLRDVGALNTSNHRFRDMISGAKKDGCPPTGVHLWVDVRDLAQSHILAMEKPEAAGNRFFIVAGKFCNREVAELIWNEFPEFQDKLPTGDTLKPGDYPPEGTFGYDNNKSKEVLGLTYRPVKETVSDTVKSLKPYL